MKLSFVRAKKIASLIRSKQISALEVTDHFIARIESLDGAINAVVVRDFERARSRARQLDSARNKLPKKLPPLFGVPMTVKESYDVAGLPSTWGSLSYRNNMAETDAVMVARLKQAGAVILGKTNVSTLLSDWQSNNPVYGVTNNPWDLARTPGGSSGGSAAALSAGLVALEAGSDIGGSLRAPAHYCGVYAHKPTWEICPMRGHSPIRNLAPIDIAVVGPMARSAEDLALALDVMAGADAIAHGWRLDLPGAVKRSFEGLRVAIMATHELCPVETQIIDKFEALARHLRKSGAKVSLTARPDFDAREAHENYLLLLHAALSARMPEAAIESLRQIAAKAAASDRSPDVVGARGAVMQHRHWLKAREQRFRRRLAWLAFFQDYDVMIAPVASTAAVRHELSDNMGARSITVDDAEITVADQLFWAGYSGNFLLPSTAAPLGFTRAGLPCGMQIIGAPYADHTTIAVAGLLERSWLGFEIPPAYKH